VEKRGGKVKRSEWETGRLRCHQALPTAKTLAKKMPRESEDRSGEACLLAMNWPKNKRLPTRRIRLWIMTLEGVGWGVN